jgi:hypothetical protein
MSGAEFARPDWPEGRRQAEVPVDDESEVLASIAGQNGGRRED